MAPEVCQGQGIPSCNADIVIVGAGIVGCASAVAFGKQGRRAVLLERDLAPPERVVGELLHPGGVRALHSLGMGGEDLILFPFLKLLNCRGTKRCYPGRTCYLTYS